MKKMHVKHRLNIKNLTLVGLVLVVVTSFLYFEPFKVTDPNNPRFNPDNFSFSDYSGGGRDETLRAALRKTFPVGTSLEYVEKVIGKRADQIVELKYGYIIYFNYMSILRYAHIFVFDKNMKLVNIKPYLDDEIYKNQSKMDDLRGWNENLENKG